MIFGATLRTDPQTGSSDKTPLSVTSSSGNSITALVNHYLDATPKSAAVGGKALSATVLAPNALSRSSYKEIAQANSQKSSNNPYLDLLNSEMNAFVNSLKNCVKGQNSTADLLLQQSRVAQLKKMAVCYQHSILHMYQHGQLSEEKVKAVFSSTFFEAEEQHNDSPPNTELVFFFLILFLDSLKKKTKLSYNRQVFINYVKECWQIHTILKIAKSYLKEHSKVVHQLIKTIIKDRLLKLQPGQKMLLPGGWKEFPEINIKGHFMLYLMERKEDLLLSKTRINTHLLPNSIEGINDRPISAETLDETKIESFVDDLTDLYFTDSSYVKGLVRSAENKHQVLFQVCTYGEEASNYEIANSFSMQNYSDNCCFMSFYLTFLYLFEKEVKGVEGEVQAFGPLKDAETFRKHFQAFLTANLAQKV